jgi:hypothetical protein
MVPVDFSPTGFIYLNPDVRCPSVEFAKQYFVSSSNRPYTTDKLPIGFDGLAYLASNVTDPSVVALNRDVFAAMVSECNLTREEILASSTIMPTVNQAAHIVSAIGVVGGVGASKPKTKLPGWKARFKFNDPSYILQSGTLDCGDRLDIACCMSPNNNAMYPPKHTDVSVVGVDISNNTFETSNLDASWSFESGTTYVVVGHHVYDVDRVASICCLRKYGRGDEFTDASAERDSPPLGMPGPCLLWSSNAAFEALRMGAWCSNTLASSFTPLVETDALKDAVHALAALSVEKSVHGVVTGLVELETGTLVASNVMARDRATIGSQFGARPKITLDVHGAVRAEDYIVSSDVRTKRDMVPLNERVCMDAVEAMAPVRYTKRGIEGGDKYGFVAQDLRCIDDMLVRCIEGFVPSICKVLDIDGLGNVRLDGHGLVLGDKLLLKFDRNEVVVNVRRIVDEGAFVIDGQSIVYNSSPMFIGHQVEDFHVVDQTHVITVLASALKGALGRIAKLECA